jgi:OOP family OmpA-OmpF porin
MNEPAARPAGGAAPGPDRRTTDDSLAALRALLVGPEQRQLRALRARLDDPAAQIRSVSAVLPEALLLRARDPELFNALAPQVEQAITASVRRNPTPLADALFPVMGPAIRKAVAASLAGMLESLNRTLEYSFSWRALKWRLTALRTGKSFAEIVLLNTLLYRVEQVFLIERASGLLLQHVRAGPSDVQDADLVSGMLTAIRDFVQDSFRVSEHDTLEALRVGDLSVWIEQGPRAVLAAVIRGTAPASLRPRLQHALETIHLVHADALAAFNGDASVFHEAGPLLEACLETQYQARTPSRLRAAPVVLGLLLAALAVWAVFVIRDRYRWSAYLDALKAEPGLLLVTAERRGGRYEVTGLRDPLARDPRALLADTRLSPDDVTGRWEPYESLEPRFVLDRARERLSPPADVTLDLNDRVLSGRGLAPDAWIEEAGRLAPLLPGIARLDARGFRESELAALQERIGAVRLLFERGTSDLVAGQEETMLRLGTDIRRLAIVADLTGHTLRIEIVGHTDSDGPDETNVVLSRERAERVRDLLPNAESSRIELVTEGVGRAEAGPGERSDEEKQRNRFVAVRVIATRDGSGSAR